MFDADASVLSCRLDAVFESINFVDEVMWMLFSACRGGENCSKKGTHCSGCGREHGEIQETKAMVLAMVSFAKKMDYQNPQDFVGFVSDKALKKLNCAVATEKP